MDGIVERLTPAQHRIEQAQRGAAGGKAGALETARRDNKGLAILQFAAPARICGA